MSKVPTATVLIADDDPHFLGVMERHLRSWSYPVLAVSDKATIFERLDANPPAVLILDVRLGPHDGLEILRQIQAEHPAVQVVMMTAFGSIESAIAAMKFGAIDYLTKPMNLQRLRAVVADAVETAAARADVAMRAGRSRPILGESEPIKRLRDMIGRAAESDSTVLVLGESGTGKELVARAIHDESRRRTGPFIAINIAAVPGELMESTLFGHVKGAFTGAERLQHGCCEAADRGSLFLDEIGEMKIELQAKLLRFLQERSFQRVGQSSVVMVDVRLIAATNRNPLEQVRAAQMREDLYYRLNVLSIVVPALRERKDDIPLLANHFLERFIVRSGRPDLSLSPDAIETLIQHDWPGNVRELENTIERAAVMNPGPILRVADISFESATAPSSALKPTPRAPEDEGLTEMERVEKAAIRRALAEVGGHAGKAAQSLGLGRATLYRKLKKFGLPTS
jgi:DNA-binding NtrC family response regulator